MNHFHLRKFMLLTVALWLALAVASQAQQCLPCPGGNTTTVTVSGSSGTTTTVSSDPVCVSGGGTVTWQFPSNAQDGATITIMFDSLAPIPQAKQTQTVTYAAGSLNNSVSVTINSGAQMGTCYQYTAQYCAGSNPDTCATILDPEVFVPCPTNNCPSTSSKPQTKTQTKPQK